LWLGNTLLRRILARSKESPLGLLFVTSLGKASVSLSEVDRQLLQRCLDRAPRAWQDFVDRFLGLVVHVANHTAEARQIRLDEPSREDLVSDVFVAIIAKDFGVLRRFRRNCSLATYLTVIARRVIARRLSASPPLPTSNHAALASGATGQNGVPTRMEDREEVERLLLRLDEKEASVVRMYHLEGKSYAQISQVIGIAENSVGPVLTRARDKMRGSGS